MSWLDQEEDQKRQAKLQEACHQATLREMDYEEEIKRLTNYSEKEKSLDAEQDFKQKQDFYMRQQEFEMEKNEI